MTRGLTLAALALGVGAACSRTVPAPKAPLPSAAETDTTNLAATGSPTDLVPSDLGAVMPVLGPFVPEVPVQYRIRWWYETRRGTTSGRGTVTVGPPDTLRFDFRAPLGRRGSVGIIDDLVLWADPDSLGTVMAGRVPLLWAALGIPRTIGDAILRKTEPSREIVRFRRGDTALTYTITPRPTVQMTAALTVPGTVLGSAILWHDSLLDQPSTGLMRLTAPDLVLRFAIDGIDTVRMLSEGWFAAPEP